MRDIQTENLVRKQVLLSEANIEKLDKLSKQQKSSVAAVVRMAIDYYDPDNLDIETTELMALVAERLKETITETELTRKRLNKTLSRLEKERAA